MLVNVLSILIAGSLGASGFSFPEVSQFMSSMLVFPSTPVLCISLGVVGHFSTM